MISETYVKAIGRICWGYFFIYIFNVNVNDTDITFQWAGYLMIYFALDSVAAIEPSAKLIKSFALVLAAVSAAACAANLFETDMDFYWINIVASIVRLYFHFQLLTNLAQAAKKQSSRYTSRLSRLRSIQTVFLTILMLLPISQRVSVSLWGDNLLVVLFALANLIVMFAICVTLFSYKGELKAIVGQRLPIKKN